ncbi:MAG: RidA family protein [Candidatus Scalindua sp.]|jgi:2-iminobutanoate/2-iminopropanoate deaminase|nr:RidA family protein [Candidatus Scalindua sp.]MDV5166161.1 RidA family protein [Candidatus Scalindua sp.]
MAKATKRYTLKDLDKMSVEAAQKLPFAARDKLLDLVIADGRKIGGKQPARQVGLMCDWFEEDVVRLQKIKAIKVNCGGFIPIGKNGEVPTLDPNGQFTLIFENVKGALKKAGTSFDRVVNTVIFMKNIDYWGDMNAIYRKYIKCSPTRAVIGCQDLNKTYQIEIVSLQAYKVRR